ncbi:plastocyanin/azurin family copper-binding protein [Pontibacter liquoris]|uniref:plastocyanin/azurin family copper-binding protein n=1 Tax=Pontibacter liquoris TaxID=2905677 RepID=UPI001FA7AEA6|nr:plastocyanin/azurin family copper-binding protein [Pontibacter liquoris]
MRSSIARRLSGVYLVCAFFLLYGHTPARVNPAPKTYTVEIKQMQFQPAELTVQKGDKIVFINRDIVTHNVTEASGKTWKSPDLISGKSWSMVATKSAVYYCSYHPVMKGTIRVQ